MTIWQVDILLQRQLRSHVKLPQPKGPQGGDDLRSFSTQPDTSLHCEITDTGLVHRAVCLVTPQLSLVLIAPTHGGMARLSSWFTRLPFNITKPGVD